MSSEWFPPAAIISGVVVLLTAFWARRASPYASLADRVVRLEERVEHLETENAVYRSRIAELERERSHFLERHSRLLAHINLLTGLFTRHAPGVMVPSLPSMEVEWSG